MLDLSTNYLGLKLKSPLVPSASPLSEKIEGIKRMEDAGAGAIVLYSLFEEQLTMEQFEYHHHTTHGAESFAEALTYVPEPDDFKAGPDDYLEHIRRAKAAVDIPIIASLNGSTLGGWTEFAQKMQEAGADAIELNIYSIPTDPDLLGSTVENQLVEIVKAVKSAVSLPVSLKLSPYYSNLAQVARQLENAQTDGLVLFNRFYQPDIDLETLEVTPNVLLSTPQALRLPLRWIGILYGRLKLDFAATSGIHTAEDVVKLLLVGSNVTMMASALLRNGVDHLRAVEVELRQWMREHEYEAVSEMQGSLSQIKSRRQDASAFERAQYMRAISSLPDEYAAVQKML